MVTRFERSKINFSCKIYDEFSIENKETGRIEEFYIQDLPPNCYNEAANFMIDYYVKDEIFQKAFNSTIDTMLDFYNFVFKQRVSLGCFVKETSELVGVNALSVKSKGIDTSFKSENERFRTIRECFAFINNHYDVFDHYNVNYFLYAHGLAVKTNYRGRGIALKILKARIPLMDEINVTVTSSLFTSKEAQQAAFNAGFHEDFSMSYKIIEAKFPTTNFSSANCEDCKLLSMKITRI